MKNYYLFILMLMLFTPNAWAEIFCVTDTASFNSALFTAQNNSEDDEIRLTSGTFTGQFQYIAGPNETHDLVISGGWGPFFDNPCFFAGASGFDTILDGDDGGLVLNILPRIGTDVTIEALSIINGNSTLPTGVGGLNIRNNATFGNVLIDRVAFIGNQAVGLGALRLLNADRATVRNSLFVVNHSTEGGNIYIGNVHSAAADGIYFHNNTVLNNTSDDTGFVVGGVSLATTGSDSGMYIASNILWGNTGEDLSLPFNTPNPRLGYNNNIEDRNGNYSASSGNYSLAPVFNGGGFFDYTPMLGGPEFDSGRNPSPFIPVPTPFGYDWSLGDFDINGNPRSQVNGVDIGAFEAAPETPIFKNGFD